MRMGEGVMQVYMEEIVVAAGKEYLFWSRMWLR